MFFLSALDASECSASPPGRSVLRGEDPPARIEYTADRSSEDPPARIEYTADRSSEDPPTRIEYTADRSSEDPPTRIEYTADRSSEAVWTIYGKERSVKLDVSCDRAS